MKKNVILAMIAKIFKRAPRGANPEFDGVALAVAKLLETDSRPFDPDRVVTIWIKSADGDEMLCINTSAADPNDTPGFYKWYGSVGEKISFSELVREVWSFTPEGVIPYRLEAMFSYEDHAPIPFPARIDPDRVFVTLSRL